MVFYLLVLKFYRSKIFFRRIGTFRSNFKTSQKEEYHDNIYVIDRGLQSTRTMKNFEEQSVKFIIRSKENRKFEEIESFLETENSVKWGDWVVLKDSKIKLYTGKPIQNKRGNQHYREEK